VKHVVKIFNLIAVFAFVSFLQSVDAASLADRHGTRGVKCENCHTSMPPQKNITEGTCIACHGSYKKIAEKTEELDVNPHDSHQGEVPCTRCHSGHKKSVLFCNGCHEFPMTVP
jgi:hypothetical protein